MFRAKVSLTKLSQAVSARESVSEEMSWTSHGVQTQPAHEWNNEFQRYVIPLWDQNYGRYYWQHYVEGS